jgi:glycosyltransferase involved in cell wall biosynthesis
VTYNKQKNNYLVVIFTESPGGVMWNVSEQTSRFFSNTLLIYGLRLRLINKFPFLLSFLLLTKNYHNLYFMFNTYTWFNVRLTEKYGAKSISVFTHYDSYDKNRVSKWKLAVKNSDILIFISKFTYSQVNKREAKPNAIFVVRPYGINLNLYKPKVNVLTIGKNRRDGRKNEIFYKNIVSNKKLKPVFDFKVIGKGWANSEEPKDYKNLKIYYDWCDILLVPSKLEGGHTPTLEALACGKIVLSANTGWAFGDVKVEKFEVDNLEEAIRKLNKLGDEIFRRKLTQAKKVVQFNSIEWGKAIEVALQKIK